MAFKNHPFGGKTDERGPSGDNSSYKKKSGKTTPRHYDPKNGSAGGGGKKPRVAKLYKPIGKNTPKAPSVSK